MSTINPIIGKMRDALSNYRLKTVETMQKIEKMKSELLPDVAAKRIDAAQSELNTLKLITIDKIMEAAKEGRKAAEDWGRIKAEDINQADNALLNSGLRLNQNEYDELCMKYRNNGTMSRILSDYADRRNWDAKGSLEQMLFTPCLATPEKKTQVWDKLEHTAHMIISNIDSYQGFASGADNTFVKASVENFGVNTEV